MERSKMAGIGLVLGMSVACAGGLTAACSSSSDEAPAVTPAADGGDGGPKADVTEPPAPTNSVTCGAAPFQQVDVQVNQFSATGTTSPLKGSAQVTYSGGCAALTTDENGRGSASLATSTSPRSVKVVPPDGFVPSLFAEAAVPAGSAKRVYTVFPDLYKALPATEWEDAKGMVVVTIAASGSAACSRADGVTLSVEGHPELTVKYYTSATTVDAAATATSAFGVAAIFHAPPGEKLKILATKPQCNASSLDAAGIGLLPIEAGTVSIATASLTDLGGPTCGPGPYIEMTGQVMKRGVDYLAAPLPGATVTWSNCAGVTATTRADGSFGVMMTKDAPFSLSIAKAEILPYRLNELSLAASGDGVIVTRDTAWKAYEPGWNDAAVSLYVALSATGSGPCATLDGISVLVKNHPEAVAHYLDTSVPPVEVAGATATTARGYVEFTGLPPGTYQFDITAPSKTCKLSMATGETGSLVALAGYENILGGVIENP